MASPTETQLRTQLQDLARVFDNYLSQQTIPSDIDTADGNILHDFAADMRSALAAVETRGSQVIPSFRGALQVWAVAFCHHILRDPERTLEACLDRIYLDWATRSPTAVTVLSRTFTRGAVTAAVANTGTGTLRRLTVDEFAYALEATFAEDIRIRCVADQNTGSRLYEEVFEFKGDNAERSDLGYKAASAKGSGRTLRDAGSTRNYHARDSIFRNSGFYSTGIAGTFAGGLYTMAAGDTISNWTIASGLTNITLDQNVVYRSPEGVTTPHSLRLAGDMSMSQTFASANVQLSTGVPYDRVLAVQRIGTADGTVTVTVGSKAMSVDVTTLTAARWTQLAPALDENLWPANFSQSGAACTVALSSNTTGEVLITELVVRPMYEFGGLWWSSYALGDDAGAGVADTILDDQFDTSDTIAADSKIQKMLWLVAGRYLPHTVAGTPPVITDP